ncbi:hypothetical protein cyc_03857 [Cyclospora cayetanensis]|uniref:Uncharacterized protein n=1 Tax=Cyclospora cayetanensis TaxID=88456 RepID=A0A1D3D5L0_9EIME|nr:hypothetical protein cyc_03857 [Cyclospora cayetanensis]
MTRRKASIPSSYNYMSELSGSSISLAASNPRVPQNSVVLKTETVEALVSWGILSSSALRRLPANGVAILNEPRSLHLRSGIGIAEVLTIALEQRGIDQLPSTEGLSQETNLEDFTKNWKHLWPYIGALGIWVGDMWSKALERGDAEAVGRLLDLITERQTGFYQNTLVQTNGALPEGSDKPAATAMVPTVAKLAASPDTERSHATSAHASAAPVAAKEYIEGCGNSGCTGTSVPCQVDGCGKLASLLLSVPSAVEQTAAPCHLASVVEGIPFNSGHCGSRPSAATSCQPQYGAAPCSHNEHVQVQLGEYNNHRRVTRESFSREKLSLTSLNKQQVAVNAVTETAPAGVVITANDSATVDRFPAIPTTRFPRMTTELPAAMTGNASSEQAQCQTAADLSGGIPGLLISDKKFLEFKHGLDNCDGCDLLSQYLTHSILQPLQHSSSLGLLADDICSKHTSPPHQFFSAVECVASEAPLRVASDLLLLQQQRIEQLDQHTNESGGELDETQQCNQQADQQREAQNTQESLRKAHNTESVAHQVPSLIQSPSTLKMHLDGGAPDCLSQIQIHECTAGHNSDLEEIYKLKTSNTTLQMGHRPEQDNSEKPGEMQQDQHQQVDAGVLEPRQQQATVSHVASPQVDYTCAAATPENKEASALSAAALSSVANLGSIQGQKATTNFKSSTPSRRRTSSIFLPFTEECDHSLNASSLDTLEKFPQQQQKLQSQLQELRQQPTQQELQRRSDKEVHETHRWCHQDNIEELLLESLKRCYGCSRRVSIRIVQKKGQLLEALFAAEGPQAAVEHIWEWTDDIKEAAPDAARRLEKEPKKLPVEAAVVLEALSRLLRQLPGKCIPLKQQLLEHLRRSAAMDTLAHMASAAADTEAYIHSFAAVRLLAAIGDTILQWTSADPPALRAGGLLRQVVGSDPTYFLLSRLVLQQQLQRQHQGLHEEKSQQECDKLRQEHWEETGTLPFDVVESMAAEACSTLVQQQTTLHSRVSALLLLGTLSHSCSSALFPKDNAPLSLLQHTLRCLRVVAADRQGPISTAAAQALYEMISVAAERGCRVIASAILSDDVLLETLLPAAAHCTAAETGVCALPVASVIALATTNCTGRAMESRFPLCLASINTSAHVNMPVSSFVRFSMLVSKTLFHSFLPRCLFSFTEKLLGSIHTFGPDEARLCTAFILHPNKLLKQMTEKLLMEDRLQKVSSTGTGSSSVTKGKDCLAESLIVILSEPDRPLLDAKTQKELLNLCEGCMRKDLTEAASRFSTPTNIGATAAYQSLPSDTERPLQSLQPRSTALAVLLDEGQRYTADGKDMEAGSSVQWLEETGSSATSSCSSIATSSMKPAGSFSMQQQGQPARIAKAAMDSSENQNPAKEGAFRGRHHPGIVYCSLSATLNAPSEGSKEANLRGAAPPAANAAAESLEEIECKLLLHYFRPVLVKLFYLLQKASQRPSGVDTFTDPCKGETLSLTALPSILQAVGVPSSSRNRVFCTNLCRALKQQIVRLEPFKPSQQLNELTLEEFEIFLCQIAFSMHCTEPLALVHQGISLTPKTERGAQILSLLHRIKREGNLGPLVFNRGHGPVVSDVPGSRTSSLPPLVRACEARLAARHADIVLESFNCLLNAGGTLHRLPPGLMLTEKKGEDGTSVKRVVLRQRGNSPLASVTATAANATPAAAVHSRISRPPSVVSVLEDASPAAVQKWAVAEKTRQHWQVREVTRGVEEQWPSKANSLAANIYKKQLAEIHAEALYRAGQWMQEQEDGRAQRSRGELERQQQGDLKQANKQLAAKAEGTVAGVLTFLVESARFVFHDPTTQFLQACHILHLQNDQAKDVSSSQRSSGGSSNIVKCRLFSNNRTVVNKTEREDIRRVQERLLQSRTMRQLLQQTQRGIQKLFEVFACGDAPQKFLNQKAWARFSLFVNLAPAPQMVCFFKQVAGSQMDLAAFQAALFQLAIVLHGLDVKSANEETVGQCFSRLATHCHLDEPKALREGLHAFQTSGKQLLPFEPFAIDGPTTMLAKLGGEVDT